MTKDRLESVLIATHGNLVKTGQELKVGRYALKKELVRFNLWPWLEREKGRMAEILTLTNGNITRSAILYGMPLQGFRKKARRLGLLPWKKRAA